MDKNTSISERLFKVIDFLGVSKNYFAKKLGYERSQALYDILNNKAKPSFDFFDKFLNSEYSVNINTDWLITGKGSMLKKEVGYSQEKDIINIVSEPQQPIVDIYKEMYYKKLEEENELLRKTIQIQEKSIEDKERLIQDKDELIEMYKSGKIIIVDNKTDAKKGVLE